MRFIIMPMIYLRWFYFHINPRYFKFTMDGNEAYFQDMKTGALLCNYKWINHKGG